MSNTAISMKTHAPDIHRWKPLPWFCLLMPRPWTIQATAGATVEWNLKWHWSNNRISGRIRWSNGLSYDQSMLECKVIKFPPWMFSMMLNTAMNRKTHAPYSHQWKPIPWFSLLRRRSWKIQETAGATVEWHYEWHWSNSRSVGRVRWSHGLSYDLSMLEWKVNKFPPWLFSMMSNTAMSRKAQAPNSHQW